MSTPTIPTHLDGVSPARISTNFSVGNQTQNRSFGEKLSVGLQQGANAIASGASVLGGVLPGSGIVSAAISSVTSHLGTSSAGYAASGITAATGSGTINSTVGAGSMGGTIASGSTAGVNFNNGAVSNDVGFGNSATASMSGDMSNMLKMQYQMQKENITYTGISNVLKTKHETTKNSISNIR